MKKTDIGVVAFFYIIGISFLVMTLQLPKAAQTYPLFIIALLLILNTMYVVKMIITAKKEGIVSGISDFEGFLGKQFAPIFAMAIAYLIIMYFVGFYIATVIFMIACLLFLKVPKIQIAVATVSVILLVYCAFTLFLGVKLPAGIIFK